MRHALPLLPVALLCASLPGQREIRAHYGPANSIFGRSLAAAGDLDGDGHDDYVVGAPRANLQAGYVQAFSGRMGQSLWKIASHVGDNRDFGAVLAGGADVNKDGTPDVLVSAPLADGSSPYAGRVMVLSGKDGQRIGELLGQWEKDGFGDAVAFAGDLDRDGYPEILVGAWQAPSGNAYGIAYVFSGRTLTLLRQHSGPSTADQIGYSVGGLDDVDADGVPDYFVAVPHRTWASGRGVVLVLSGKDGRTIHEIRLAGTNWLGRPAVALGDIDRDGIADLGLRRDNGVASSSLTLFSGKTGAAWHEFSSSNVEDSFASSFCNAGDVDRDGVPDVCVGACQRVNAPGYAMVYSGRTGSALYKLDRQTPAGRFGLVTASLGDVDGNGEHDFAVGAPEFGNLGGAFYVFDGSQPSLRADLSMISLASGGTQRLDLEAGLLHATKVYLLLGSMTGTTPGIRLGSHVLPLVPDAYFTLTLGNPNLAPLSTSFGLLDTSGRGVARFTLPAKSPPSLLYLVLRHAYVVLSPPLAVDYASQSQLVVLVD